MYQVPNLSGTGVVLVTMLWRLVANIPVIVRTVLEFVLRDPDTVIDVLAHPVVCTTRSLHGTVSIMCRFCGNGKSLTEVLEFTSKTRFIIECCLPNTLNKIIGQYISRNEDLDHLRSMRRIQMEKSNQCVEDIKREMNLYNSSNYVNLDNHFVFHTNDPDRNELSFFHCLKCANRSYCSGYTEVESWEDPVYAKDLWFMWTYCCLWIKEMLVCRWLEN